MTERRFNEDEVAAIFRAATEGESAAAAAPSAEGTDGLTLSELQSIAGEVGISKDAVTRAAQSLDVTPPRPTEFTLAEPPERFLGLPVSVRHIVPLDRPLTDHEWEILVGELRQIFQARGKLSASGSLREWRNGALHALTEPTLSGYQLRLGTTKTNARMSVIVGGLGLALSVGLTAVAAIAGTLHFVPFVVYATAAVSAVLLHNGTVGLRRWAARRREQMALIGERVKLLTKG